MAPRRFSRCTSRAAPRSRATTSVISPADAALCCARLSASATQAAIAAIWKRDSARLIGVLTRIVRDVGLAEELVNDAMVKALEDWPRTGVPDEPVGWLMTTAKRRAIDAVRRHRM